jgi:general stress protein 26
MMRNPEQTIGNMVDKSNMTLISYIDDEGYSGGVKDPDCCVLKFTTSKGRYYSNFKSEDFEI